MRKYFFCLATVFSVFQVSHSNAQLKILTIAGKGVEGYTGDNAMADTCMIHWPEAVLLDEKNNVFIADANNNVIRKISGATGRISTVAGTGFQSGTGHGGFGGDGGPATAARLFYPSGMAYDSNTHIMYIADQHNNRIRKIDATGIMTTYAGNGTLGFAGDGGPAINALLNSPTRVALDPAGNLYVADSGNNRVRKVDLSGNISTVAGIGTRGYSGDGSAATSAQLNNPIDVAIDPAGNLIIADYVNNRIRKVTPGGIISTIAGIGIAGFAGDNGPATAANIYEPSGLFIDVPGNIYFSDLANFRVRKIDPTGIITTLAGNGSSGYNGDGINANAASLWFPEGLAMDSRGQIYVADKGNNRIRLLSGVLAAPSVNAAKETMLMFPNPSTGKFTINVSSELQEEVRITIVSLTGSKVAEITANTNTQVEFQLNAAPGLYMISAASAHGIVNERLMIQ